MRPPRRARREGGHDRAFTLTIAHHADPSRVGDSATLGTVSNWRRKVSRLEPEFVGTDGAFPLADRAISRRPFEIHCNRDVVSVMPSNDGAVVEVAGVAIDSERVLSDDELIRGVTLAVSDRTLLVLRRGSERRGGGEGFGLIGVGAEVRELVEQIERAAKADANVLVRGATGTGKELVAAAIHQAGSRQSGPFVAVNMTTLTPSTATSQLFGHVEGAFTGASADHGGFFSAASGGTLFLDEVGETPINVQAMLLRSIETGEVTAVGQSSSTKVDVRVVAATDADLETLVEQGQFRAPLLHRLSGLQISLVSLASRREDIGPLLFHFLSEELAKLNSNALAGRGPSEALWLSVEQVSRLVEHHWPGNVRQLRNVARHLAVACGDAEEVSDDQVDRAIGKRPETARTLRPSDPAAPGRDSPSPKRRPEQINDDELVEVLRAHDFSTSKAAATLGISRTSLYALIEKCPRVRKARDLGDDEVRQALAAADGSSAAAARALEVSERGLKLRIKELGIVGD